MSLGFFWGCMFDNMDASKESNGFSMMLFMMAAGTFANTETFPIYMEVLERISPLRYLNELLFRRFVSNTDFAPYPDPLVTLGF